MREGAEPVGGAEGVRDERGGAESVPVDGRRVASAGLESDEGGVGAGGRQLSNGGRLASASLSRLRRHLSSGRTTSAVRRPMRGTRQSTTDRLLAQIARPHRTLPRAHTMGKIGAWTRG